MGSLVSDYAVSGLNQVNRQHQEEWHNEKSKTRIYKAIPLLTFGSLLLVIILLHIGVCEEPRQNSSNQWACHRHHNRVDVQ